jgi:hypothetical protein
VTKSVYKVKSVEKAIVLVKKEKQWLSRLASMIFRLRKVVDKKDLHAANILEAELSNFERHYHKIDSELNQLIEAFPSPLEHVLELRNKLVRYDSYLLNQIVYSFFGEKGVLPRMLRQKTVDWEQVKLESSRILRQGIIPSNELLRELLQEFQKILDYYDMKKKFSDEVWWGRLSPLEQQSRIREMGETVEFIHACASSQNPLHLVNGGKLNPSFCTTGGFWMGKSKKDSLSAAGLHSVASNIVFIKIIMRKKIADQFVYRVPVSDRIQGMHPGFSHPYFYRLAIEDFKRFNNEISNGTVIFQRV